MKTSEISTCLKNKTHILHSMSDEEARMLKRELLEIMDDVIEVCEKYEIKYCLAGGSVLGAIRHQGFIPWDDDLDIFMTRQGIRRLLKIFDSELSNKYVLQAPNSKYECGNNFLKIRKKNTELIEMDTINLQINRGIYIDIFPLDYAPNRKIFSYIKGGIVDVIGIIGVSQFMYKNRNDVVKTFYYTNKQGKRHYNIRIQIGKLASFMSYEKWYDLFDMISRGKKSNYITVASGRGHYIKERLPVNVFFPFSEGIFEGRKVWLPNNPDKYLKNLYGDYRLIPPVEKREQHYIIKVIFNKEEN